MGLFSSPRPNPADSVRLARLERKVDAILAHLGIEVEEAEAGGGADGMDDIRALAESGRKIEAIKLYRERTGAGLAEAKEAVERGV